MIGLLPKLFEIFSDKNDRVANSDFFKKGRLSKQSRGLVKRDIFGKVSFKTVLLKN